METKTNLGLVAYARAQLGKPYWFGTFGQIATKSIYEYNKGRLPSYYTAKDFTAQFGQRVHDCAGLIKGYLWSDAPDTVPKYASGGVPDISADQMRKSCTETGDIATLPEIPGVLLFYSGHVGVYIGNGMAIEARGHAYGVVQTAVKSRSWKWWGKLKYLEYVKETKEVNTVEYSGRGKLGIYVNSAKKSMDKVKEETGCTALINGGLFDMAAFKPIAQLKVNGNILAKEDWGTNYGIGWNDVPYMTADMAEVRNFIACICMVRNGTAVKMSYPADMGGARQRTALGIFPDGRIWMYATLTKTTPEALQKLAIGKGVKDAIMLDGGGSTQGSSPSGTVKASRIVHNFICLYEGDKAPKEAPKEKTYTVKSGDTWWGIATAQLGSGARMTELAKHNGKTTSYVLHPGDVLKIPG